MSHAAIAAVLAREDLTAGERLAALSLASYANSEHRAWPGKAAASARAGLGVSRYLEARDQLVRRGLVDVEQPGRGRGQQSLVRLVFAQAGPWWDGGINAQLLEDVLGYSRTRGSARLLLAAMAALADANCVIEDLSTEELCHAAGLSDSTYRRARTVLLNSGEVELIRAGGGRQVTNRWRVRQPRASGTEPRKGAGRAKRAVSRSKTPDVEHPTGRAQDVREHGRHERCDIPGNRGRRLPGLGERWSHRSRFDEGFRWKGSEIDRGCRRKGSRIDRGFGSKGSGIDRGFRRKGRGRDHRGLGV